MTYRNILPIQLRIFKKIIYQLPLMNQFFLSKEVFLAVSTFFICQLSFGQDCANIQSLCPNTGAPESTFADGTTFDPAPAGSCFEDSLSSVFYSFSTLDVDQFPSIDYSETDSTAILQFSIDSCATDTLFAISLLQTASPCNPDVSEVISCNDFMNVSGQVAFSQLLPSTTYQVMITNLDTLGTLPQCAINVSVSGSAVVYDLNAVGFQQGADPSTADDATEIFEGETIVLTSEEGFGDISWDGPQLNQSMGSEVTANPEGVGISVNYTASAEIDGCTYEDNVSVFILPPIVTSNAFTPNGDGFNDTWWIEGIDLWPNAQIFVYSRWGNKVFQAINYENDWGGDDLPAATYYYVIELNPVDFDAEPITGSVTIMR